MQCKIIRCHSRILKFVAAITVLAGSSVAIADDRPTNRKSARQDSPFAKWDKNSDGFLTRKEFPTRFGAGLFDRIDANADGRISRKEDDSYRASNRARQREQNRTKKRASRRRPMPPNPVAHKDLIYTVVGDRKLPLDLYIPEKSKQALPLVIWIHGGGWRSGSKANPRQALSLLKHGYAVASVEYRLSGEAIFPAAIEDCKAAVSFLRLNAAKYNLDPNRFGAWGSSAGGHLVALLGTTNDVSDFNTHDVCKQASPAVQAVCNWFGPTDFLRMNDFKSRIDHDSPSSPESKFIGGSIQKNKQQVARANPITYVSKSDPPMLIMHGDVDQLVPFNQSELLIAALRKQKVESTLYKVKRGGHGFGGAVDKPEKLFKLVVNFFNKQLK